MIVGLETRGGARVPLSRVINAIEAIQGYLDLTDDAYEEALSIALAEAQRRTGESS